MPKRVVVVSVAYAAEEISWKCPECGGTNLFEVSLEDVDPYICECGFRLVEDIPYNTYENYVVVEDNEDEDDE